MAMHVTNLTGQDYWFGPLHLPGGGAIDVDDTDDTSLYLNDDSVADAINTLYASNKIAVTGQADPFPRATGTPEVLHGDGSPEGVVFAGQGSLYLRRDSGSIYTKKTGIHVNTGWASIAQGAITTASPWSSGPPSTPNDGDIWIATGIGSLNQRWQFQYDANETSSSKWKFIGGTPLLLTNSLTPTADASWHVDSSNISLARAGDYRASLSGWLNKTTSNNNQMSFGFGINGTQSGATGNTGYGGALAWTGDDSFAHKANVTVSGGDTLAAAFNDGSSACQFTYQLEVVPIRIA